MKDYFKLMGLGGILCAIIITICIIIAYRSSKKENYPSNEYESLHQQMEYPFHTFPIRPVEQMYQSTFSYSPNSDYIMPTPYNWKQNAERICSQFNNGMVPKKIQDCPNSSFDFVYDLKKYIKDDTNVEGGGCIQIGIRSQPNCYNDKDGKYKPWMERLKVSSP